MDTNKAQGTEWLIGEDAQNRADFLLETALRKVIDESTVEDDTRLQGLESPYGVLSKDNEDDGLAFHLDSPVCRARLTLRNRVLRPESGVVETRAELAFDVANSQKVAKLPSLYVHVDTYKDDVTWFYNTVLHRPLAAYIGTARMELAQGVTFVGIEGYPLEVVPGWTDKHEGNPNYETLELALSQECENAIKACAKEHGARFTGFHSFSGARNVTFYCGPDDNVNVEASVMVGPHAGLVMPVKVNVRGWTIGQSGAREDEFIDETIRECDLGETPLCKRIWDGVEGAFIKADEKANKNR